MARFRFRPQAALDMRRREHDTAQRELARADAERQRLAALLQEAVVAERRQACLEARRRQEALERLRERAYAAYLAAEAEHERKMVDEVAAQRFARRSLTEGV